MSILGDNAGMQRPIPVPSQLRSAPFTLKEAKAAGLAPSQIWNRVKIEGVSQGIYRCHFQKLTALNVRSRLHCGGVCVSGSSNELSQ